MGADSTSIPAGRILSGVEPDLGVIIKTYDEEKYGNTEKTGGDFAAFFLGLVVPAHGCPVR